MCRKNILKYLGTAGVAVVLFITHLAAADTYDVERTNPINILFDSKGTQTLINNSTNTPTLATNSRLATILAALSNYGQNSSNTVNGITNVDTSFPKYIISYTSNNN
jgi:hypothetical protein